MKNAYSVILIICFALSIGACKKDKDNDNDNGNNELVGSWELAQTTAAMQPGATEYSSGNGNILTFKSSTYKRYRNGQVVKSGIYTIVEDNTVEKSVCLNIDDNRYTHRIILHGDESSDKTFFDIRDGKLNFISGCYAVDAGHTSNYRRVQNIDGIGTN